MPWFLTHTFAISLFLWIVLYSNLLFTETISSIVLRASVVY